MNRTSVKWRRKEQLPDGRWQHYCVGCNQPLTEDRFYESDFTFKVPCSDCAEPPTGRQRLMKSQWE